MHAALECIAHRPWAVPARRWSWRQSWCDLLFAHWPVPAAQLRRVIPPSLTVQEFGGTAWIGVVPFRMEGVMLRPLPDLPWLSTFPELNVRSYVERNGKPGVWFLSLDAANPLAVWAARRFFHLPYFRAEMRVEAARQGVSYRSQRVSSESGPVFEARYAPCSEPFRAAPGTLEHWLTERYCLYALSPRGRLYRTEVHHRPWPLQRAEAHISRNEMAQPHGVSVDTAPALLHFSRRLDVVLWSPEPESA